MWEELSELQFVEQSDEFQHIKHKKLLTAEFQFGGENGYKYLNK